MTVLMRALNLSNDFITWTSTSPDYEGAYAPEAIQSDSAIVVADTGGGTIENIGKLGLEYDPVALWLFDGNLNDSSGNGFDLTGAPSYTTAAIDRQAGAIFGGTAWTRPSRDAALAITGALTIECTLNTELSAVGGSICSFAGVGETEILNSCYLLRIAKSKMISIFWESGAGIDQYLTSPVGILPEGIPTHIAVTRSASNPAVTNIYLNGVNVLSNNTKSACTGGTSATVRLRIGTDENGTEVLGTGNILTSLKIIAAELTPAQVVAEYNKVLGGKGIVYPAI
jgi:hypothetical protein